MLRGAVTVIALALTGCNAIPAQVPVQRAAGIFVERGSGRTLYTYDRDDAPFAQQFCSGDCLKGWTPLAAPPGAKAGRGFSLIERNSEPLQWAYRDRPLYLRDGEAAGERAGHGVENLWRIARP